MSRELARTIVLEALAVFCAHWNCNVPALGQTMTPSNRLNRSAPVPSRLPTLAQPSEPRNRAAPEVAVTVQAPDTPAGVVHWNLMSGVAPEFHTRSIKIRKLPIGRATNS